MMNEINWLIILGRLRDVILRIFHFPNLQIHLTVAFLSIFLLSGPKSFASGQEDFTITGATISSLDTTGSKTTTQTPAVY
jgi:hypothetical protein